MARHASLMAAGMLAIVLAACAPTAVRLPGPTAESAHSTGSAEPTASRSATWPPTTTPPEGTQPPGEMAIDCGPLAGDPASCLAAASAAVLALPADHPVVETVDIEPWAPTGPAGADRLPTSATDPRVTVDTTVTAVGVTVGQTGRDWLRTTVFEGAEGWVAGEPPAATRAYSASQPVRDWQDVPAFEIAGGEYLLGARCFGDPPTKASALGRLERMTAGRNETLGSFSCGPVELGDAFETHLALEAGQYRVVIEASTGHLQVWFQPVHGD